MIVNKLNLYRLQVAVLIVFFIPGFKNSILCGQQNDSGNLCIVIDTSEFRSSAMHWYHIPDKSNVINPIPGQGRYKGDQIQEIAENILLYQQKNGGWPKNYDMFAVLSSDQKNALLRAKGSLETTFDNLTTYSHIRYLAMVFNLTAEEKYKNACLKGIDFILEAQYPNGGWPQAFPLKEDYSRNITFNDDSYIGLMRLLKEMTKGKSCYGFIDPSRRNKISLSYERGMACLLRCQLIIDGKATAWCQQYDEKTLLPVSARAFEPVAISALESAGIVLFLMDIDNPTTEIINAVHSASVWFKNTAIQGIKIEKKGTSQSDTADNYKTDIVVVKDSLARPIWSRFYEIPTQRPIFSDRRGKILYSLAEVEIERRMGYAWYTNKPQEVLNQFESWSKIWLKD
jgi:PelA/Pel-15E family pectate lyase